MQHGVLISGTSTGIGRACATLLARRGVVVFAGVRRLDDGERLRDEVGDRIVPVLLDVTDPAQVANAIEEVVAANGRRALSGLVNNAGVALGGPLEFLPIDAVRAQFEANVLGTLALTQACLPLLRTGAGRIVNMSSISGRFASPLQGAYASSKFAVEALSDALRRELAPWGIQVSVVQPGRVATPIWHKSVGAAEALLADLPPEALEFYGPSIERAKRRAHAHARAGIPAERVAAVVETALTAQRPRTRYLVGRDARVGAALAAWLPDAMLDRLARLRSAPAGER